MIKLKQTFLQECFAKRKWSFWWAACSLKLFNKRGRYWDPPSPINKWYSDLDYESQGLNWKKEKKKNIFFGKKSKFHTNLLQFNEKISLISLLSLLSSLNSLFLFSATTTATTNKKDLKEDQYVLPCELSCTQINDEI